MSDEELERREGETPQQYIDRIESLPTDELSQHARRVLDFEIDVALDTMLRKRENEQRRAILDRRPRTVRQPRQGLVAEAPADLPDPIKQAFLALPPGLRERFLHWAVTEGESAIRESRGPAEGSGNGAEHDRLP